MYTVQGVPSVENPQLPPSPHFGDSVSQKCSSAMLSTRSLVTAAAVSSLILAAVFLPYGGSPSKPTPSTPKLPRTCATSRIGAAWGAGLVRDALALPALQRSRRSALEAEINAETEGEQFKTMIAGLPKFTCPGPMVRLGGHTSVVEGPHVWAEWEGSHQLCDVSTLRAPCAVFSLGGNDEWSFEDAIIANTPCDVYTFDCTIDKPSGRNGTRRVFDHTCIGPAHRSTPGREWATLSTLVKRHGLTKVDLLKADIEAGEYEMFDEFAKEAAADWEGTFPNLPDQIVFEMHSSGAGGMLTLMDNAFSLGYVVVAHEPNWGQKRCYEYTMLKLPQSCVKPSPVLRGGAGA